MPTPLWVLSEGEPSKFWEYHWYADELPARKFYSFIAEIGRRLRHLMTDDGPIQMIEFCEQCADGVIDEDQMSDLADEFRADSQRGPIAASDYANGIYWWVADRSKVSNRGMIEHALEAVLFETAVEQGLLQPRASYEEIQAIRDHPVINSTRERTERDWGGLVCCIYGPNPFVPQPFSPSWRTEHTTGIAAKMYDDRDFAAMPILADALEEAGCDNIDILTHCREPGVHVRGCWVVDLVLGKS